ncbi:hypothetical protein CEP52_015761 [Fusarium oligoseptatum]|uniref:Uncharacterized protein n=1 Tax=Fusarium oligoseptatum TaxID=2604345 RepID=A0A428SA50_9HYPO|nr:hypothetical protein CEP52_015761 [Fusarium oligoseptatum]
MSDKKQSITLREINTTYPGPNAQRTSWTQGKSNPPQSITLRPTQDVPPILINDVPLKDLQANTPAGKAWIPEEDEEIDVPRSVVRGTIKFRPDPPLFPGSSPASDSSTDIPTSTRTLLPRVPPGFTEAHRGQANLYDRPLHLIPSGYSHENAQGIHQLDSSRTPSTPRREKTPTDVYSSASSYLSRNGLPPIRTTGLNPVANNFTPGASSSPMSGPLSPELARDKMYLDNQAKIQWSRMYRPVVGVGQQQVSENQKEIAGQDSYESCQVIRDEREHAEAVNDWFWAQAKQAPVPKPEEPKE